MSVLLLFRRLVVSIHCSQGTPDEAQEPEPEVWSRFCDYILSSVQPCKLETEAHMHFCKNMSVQKGIAEVAWMLA